MLTNEERIALYLTEPPSLNDVIKTRKFSEYYNNIIKGKSALTLEDIEIINDVLVYGLNLVEKPSSKVIKIEGR